MYTRGFIEKTLRTATLLTLLALTCASQSGGDFVITQSVVATGGGSSSGGFAGSFRVEGTTGQNIAGTESSAGPFSVHGGFWTPSPLAPTAATVRVGGRVERLGGVGISNASLILTDVSTGSTRMARSSPFGYFYFDEVPVGEFYILTVNHRSYTFVPDSYSFNLVDEPPEIVFRAE